MTAAVPRSSRKMPTPATAHAAGEQLAPACSLSHASLPAGITFTDNGDGTATLATGAE